MGQKVEFGLGRIFCLLHFLVHILATNKHHIELKDSSSCPVDEQDLNDRDAIASMSFDLHSPPQALIEDRAQAIANQVSDSSLKQLNFAHKSCCVPFPLHLWSAIENGLVAEPPSLGESAKSKIVTEAEKKKRVRAAKTRPVNIVGSHDQQDVETNFWDHGWHYERTSGGCDRPFSVNSELSFTREPLEGCARYAVILSGPLQDMHQTLVKFQQHVINSAFGDVDVFIYGTLAPNDQMNKQTRQQQMKMIQSLKRGDKPWVMAAVIEEATNVSSTNQILTQCLGGEEPSGQARRKGADTLNDACYGQAIEIGGTTLKRAIWQGQEEVKEQPKLEDETGGQTFWSENSAAMEAERLVNEVRDSSCCALCKAEPNCEFWVRNKKGDCWLMKDALWSASSSVRRSGMVRAPKLDPLNRLSRSYALASSVSSPSTAAFASEVFMRRKQRRKLTQVSTSCEACGVACWRQRFETYLLQSRANYLGAKLVARHSARYGCQYSTILLARPGQRYSEDVSWNSPAEAAQAALLFAESQADEVLADRERSATEASDLASKARKEVEALSQWKFHGSDKSQKLLDKAERLEALARAAHDAIRRPPVMIDRPYASKGNPKGNKKVSGTMGLLQKWPLVFTSTTNGAIGASGGVGRLRSEMQRRHVRAVNRCEVEAFPSRVVLGAPTNVYEFASLYRDFSDWWPLMGPRRSSLCSAQAPGSRFTALQLHWRQVWFLEKGRDLLTPLSWEKLKKARKGEIQRVTPSSSSSLFSDQPTKKKMSFSQVKPKSKPQTLSFVYDESQSSTQVTEDSEKVEDKKTSVSKTSEAPKKFSADWGRDSEDRPPLDVMPKMREEFVSQWRRLQHEVGFRDRSVESQFIMNGSRVLKLSTPADTHFNGTLFREVINNLELSVFNASLTSDWINNVLPIALKDSPPSSPLLKKQSSLVFTHIPKTGGSTLISVLDALNRDRPPLCYRRYMYSFERESQHSGSPTTPCEPINGNSIFGHNSFDPKGLAKVLHNPAGSVHHMVFVREPLSRIVSFANFNEEPLQAWSDLTSLYAGWRKYAINAMTGMINGVVGIGPGIGSNYLFSEDARSCAHHPAKNAKSVQYAKYQLKATFSFVGDTANFEESVWLLHRTFGWPQRYALFSLSHSKRSFDRGGKHRPGWSRWTVDDLSPKLQKIIRDVEVCDCEVYKFASEMVKSRIRDMPLKDQADLVKFKKAMKKEDTRLSNVLRNTL